MFETTMAFYPEFRVESRLDLAQLDCYKARAQSLRARHPWSPTLNPLWTGFLVHLSANVPGKVAYYASIENMVGNRLTRTSPEMFLKRTLESAPEELQAAWISEVMGNTLPVISFMENDNPDGWRHVYDIGPGSCMKGNSIVRQYAHPKNHLALAYHQTATGTITFRTIVNKERKTYLRAYSRETDIAYYIAALNKLGYKQDNDTLHGEVVTIDWAECSGCDQKMLVFPYLDGNNCSIRKLNKDEGVIGNNGYDPYYCTDGYTCDNCSDRD